MAESGDYVNCGGRLLPLGAPLPAALTPRLEARLVPGSDTKVLVGVVGFEICWWSGLPRNQLELPASEAYKVTKK
jgi:hypothetical protein